MSTPIKDDPLKFWNQDLGDYMRLCEKYAEQTDMTNTIQDHYKRLLARERKEDKTKEKK